MSPRGYGVRLKRTSLMQECRRSDRREVGWTTRSRPERHGHVPAVAIGLELTAFQYKRVRCGQQRRLTQ